MLWIFCLFIQKSINILSHDLGSIFMINLDFKLLKISNIFYFFTVGLSAIYNTEKERA